MPRTIDLNCSESGFHGLITHIGGDRDLRKKLMSLGLRKGQEIAVLQQRRNGVVVLSNGSRVPLGTSVAAQVFLQPLAQ